MDDFGKNISMIMILMILAIIWTVGCFTMIVHDENILGYHHREAETLYFIQSDNLTNQEKYDFAKSICSDTFSNQSLYDELWLPKIPIIWDIEGHKEHEINRCECNLLEIG